MSGMHIYMGFSRSAGPEEGAILIFAHTAQEARVVGWGFHWVDEYIDFSVRLLRNSDWLYNEANQDKLKKDIPHANDNPHICKRCEMWGHAEILENGFCEDCNADAELGDVL